jgi:hypothetical protein
MLMNLRYYVLTFLALAATAAALSAQPLGRVVQETERMMSFGSRPGFRLEFPVSDVKQVETQWKDFVKRNFDAKLKKDKKSGEWTAYDVRTPILGSDVFTIYSTVERLGSDGSALTVWFDAGAYFLNRASNPQRTDEAVGTLRQFYYDMRRETLSDELKTEEKRLKDLEDRQKRLQRDNDNLYRDIEAYKERIKKAEDTIKRNEKDQESAVADIEAQRRRLEEVKRRRENVENEGQ